MVFLQDIGLPNQTLTPRAAKKVKIRPLKHEELRTAHEAIMKIKDALVQKRIQVSEFIQSYIKRYGHHVGPNEFHGMLKETLPEFMATKPFPTTVLKDLMHYLVKEEPGKASLIKMAAALNLKR